MTQLFLRCDASASIGTGHFFRMLALGEAANDRGLEALLVCASVPDGLLRQARASGVSVEQLEGVEPGKTEDAEALAVLASERKTAGIVVDGYHFKPAFYAELGRAFPVVAAVDDIGHQRFPVDVLINANPGSDRIAYEVPGECLLLLGLRYALLRRQFRRKRRVLEAHGGREVPETVHRLLVFLGGGDPTNVTVKVLQALRTAAYDGRADVLVGPANPHGELIRAEASKVPGQVKLHSNVTNVADLMVEQDLAMCAAGSVSWELACLGVPMCQLVVANNQQGIAEELADRGVTEFAGRSEEVEAGRLGRRLSSLLRDRKRRSEMSSRAWNLVDGEGTGRVLDELRRVKDRRSRQRADGR